jgi:general secretion pathway protein A
MYEAFFGLRERPFDLAANPRFLFLTPRHREALSTLRYGLSAPRGLTLLLGDAGTGKTTLLHAALADDRRAEHRHVLISNPTLNRAEFYQYIARGFGLPADCSASKADFLHEFQKDIAERHAAGGLTTLIIDESQSLPYELLEEVRLLANIETATVKLLNVVLVGQPELADRLNEARLRQLKQRITLRTGLSPLTLRETAAYIAGRLSIAGGSAGQIFTREAIVSVHAASHGLPRIINVVCDNALIGGFAAGVKPIGAAIVQEICRDFDFELAVNGNGLGPGHEAASNGARAPDAAGASSSGAAPVLESEAPGDENGVARKRRFLFF